jgi:hypothetical protein
MTLKLVSKSLPNRYAEQLYKNELNYSSDINKQNDRIQLDYLRNSHYVDIASHVFLNKIRQKRTQWKKDDVRYREYYKTICKNSYLKYLENNKNRVNDNKFLNRFNSDRNVLNLEVIADKASNLQRANSQNDVHTKEELVLPPIIKPKSVEKMERPELNTFSLPKYFNLIQNKPFANGKYSATDRGFLESLPEKVELTNTEVGRKYLNNKREQKKMINTVKRKFSIIQTNAVNDTRFKNLVSSLDV